MTRLDRNARARLMVHAEALDRRTRLPGQHGGVLKRTGLAVLKALLFGFANVITGGGATRATARSPRPPGWRARPPPWPCAGSRTRGC